MNKRVARVVGDVTSLLSVDLFRSLADSNRIAIVAWLAAHRQPRTVSEIAASGCCNVDLSVVSRHLRSLRDAGVVEARRDGREVYYRLRADVLARALRRIADLLDTCCAPNERPVKE
jgi:ArsR family transcriptional regulator